MTQTAENDFDLSGGGSGNAFSFGPQGSQPGATITGVVLDMKEVQRTNFDTKKPEFWDNGDPKMQYRVTLQTELRDPERPHDDGKRDLYLDGRRKPNDNGTKSRLCAVLDAVREVTGNTSLQRGGRLTVQWISGMGFAGDPRNYVAQYVAPAMNLGGQSPAAPVAQASAPASVPTEQGPVNPGTGEVQAAPQVTSTFVNAQGQPATREAIAALRAAGVDPVAVYAGYDGSLG